MELSLELRRTTGFQYILDTLTFMSPFGGDLMRMPELYGDADALKAEFGRVTALLSLPDSELLALTNQFDRQLMCMKDIRGSLRRCAQGETLSILGLFEVKGLLLTLAEIRSLYDERLHLKGLSFSDSRGALAVLDPSGEGKHSFTVEDAATPELFAVRREKRAVEAELYKTTDDARRAELKLKRDAVCAAEDRQERAVCAALCQKLAPYCDGLIADCTACGRLDVLLRKASMRAQFGAVVPEIGGDAIEFADMTNPEIAASLQSRDGKFTPLSMTLRAGATVITGANMGGKTVALKTLAMNAMLAMAGFPVCAASGRVPMLKQFLFLSGDAQKAEEGLSSFGGEVVRIRDAVAAYNADTLLLLDEPARGTNPDEGACIVRGLTEYLNAEPGYAVLSTHYDGVACHAGGHYRIKGLRGMDRDAVRAELASSSAPGPEIIARHMDYGLYPADPLEACPREALDICRLLGMPEELVVKIQKFY
jgi:DNA mismatch repair protein MutS2